MYIGDFALGKTFDVKFTTIDSTGAPITLAGTPVVSAYPDNSVTELTAGITLTVDFDSRTGLHNVRVVATSGNGYATATNYALVITTGTVNSISVVGYVIGHFSIENRSALRPATADRTIVVDSSGIADANVQKVGGSPQSMVLGTVGSSSSTTSIVTSSLTPAAAVTDQFKGRVVIFNSDTTTANLRGQATDITASTSGGVLTVTALTTAPVSGDTFVIV